MGVVIMHETILAMISEGSEVRTSAETAEIAWSDDSSGGGAVWDFFSILCYIGSYLFDVMFRHEYQKDI